MFLQDIYIYICEPETSVCIVYVLHNNSKTVKQKAW